MGKLFGATAHAGRMAGAFVAMWAVAAAVQAAPAEADSAATGGVSPDIVGDFEPRVVPVRMTSRTSLIHIEAKIRRNAVKRTE